MISATIADRYKNLHWIKKIYYCFSDNAHVKSKGITRFTSLITGATEYKLMTVYTLENQNEFFMLFYNMQ